MKPATGRPRRTSAPSLYEGYALQAIHIADAQPHPTKLVQSAAMAAVAPPRPSYRPYLPPRLLAAGILSDAQLESVIYAGEAHAGHLAGSYTVDETYDLVSAAPEGAEGAVRFRRGWFLGDGTGAGKGRQVAAIILDNWLKGRPPRRLWISKSDKLIEDARTRLDGDRRLPLRHRSPVALSSGRCDRARGRHPLHHLRHLAHPGPGREGQPGAADHRLARPRPRLGGRGSPGSVSGASFDGIIVFDEAHAMANAAGDKGERGEKKPSQQGQAGLRLQNALA